MEKLNIIAMVYFSIIILWVVLPLFASIGACLIKYWTRERLDYKPMEWLKCKLWSSNGVDEAWEYYAIFHIVLPTLLLAATSWLIVYYAFLTLVSLIFLVIFIFLPRYLCDIINSLKFNFKKADSERLLELEEEIQKLKSNTRNV